MEKEFNLSLWVMESYHQGDYDLIDIRPVKEFIKLDTELIRMFLKGEINASQLHTKRRKLAGEKFIIKET